MRVFALAAVVMALQTPAVPEGRHLTLVTSTSAAAVAPGKKLSLLADVTPKPGIHVYAPGQEGYIAITLTLDSQPGVSAVGKVKYPAPEKFVMPALNETQLVYSKPFRISQDISLADTPQTRRLAELTIKGKIRYQACDDKICYLPATIPVTWIVKRSLNPSSLILYLRILHPESRILESRIVQDPRFRIRDSGLRIQRLTIKDEGFAQAVRTQATPSRTDETPTSADAP